MHPFSGVRQQTSGHSEKKWTPCQCLYIRSPLNSETEGPCPCGTMCTVEDIPSGVHIFRDLPRVQAHPHCLLVSYFSLLSCSLCLCKSWGVCTLWVRCKALFIINSSISLLFCIMEKVTIVLCYVWEQGEVSMCSVVASLFCKPLTLPDAGSRVVGNDTETGRLCSESWWSYRPN